MALPLDSIAEAPFAAALRLPTDAVVARTRQSGADVERIAASGELAVEALPLAYLEVGGTAIAEGRIVSRRGASYFKIERLFGSGGSEAMP